MTRIGVIYTADNANDREAWRWCGDDVTLLITRAAPDPSWLEPGDGAAAEPPLWVPTDREIHDAVRTLILADPAVVTYACTSGSFSGPVDQEQHLRQVMTHAGARVAQTTSGALLDALAVLGVHSLAVATPYYENTAAELRSYLERSGYKVASLVNVTPAPGKNDAELAPSEVVELACRADRLDADALFMSCAALESFDAIPVLESTLGKPVLTAMQVTMWAALGAAGAHPVAAPQALLSHAWRRR
jgi:maleate isomerase